ncbi:hypothetical protein L1276_005067 [Flavobacterium sp. HSC-32F16]|nr:hypothetical protein [Flavobacterium sp. HSC-32F16]
MIKQDTKFEAVNTIDVVFCTIMKKMMQKNRN